MGNAKGRKQVGSGMSHIHFALERVWFLSLKSGRETHGRRSTYFGRHFYVSNRTQ